MSDLSIVIPAYNEEQRLPASLRRMRKFLSQLSGLETEVLVVVEKSRDRTLEAARAVVAGDERFQVLDNRIQRGKGYAVRCGMQRASGKVVFFMDADLSTPLEEIPRFLTAFQEHPEVQILIGSRAETASRILRRQNTLREWMGRTFNRLVQRLAVSGIADTQCGFKAFRARACREIFARQQLDGFAFDVEVLLLAKALGFPFMALPVSWENSPDSRVRMVRDSLQMLWELLRVHRLVARSLRQAPARRPISRS